MQFNRIMPSVFLATFFAASMAIKAATINVPGDQPTIQAGIDAAVPGDEVVVAPGMYNEVINFNGKDITVRSSGGRDVTTIDGSGLNDSVVKCMSGEGPGAILDGFTITGGTGNLVNLSMTFGGGMRIVNSSPHVLRCRFFGNTADRGGGMSIENLSSALVSHCNFVQNVANDSYGASGIDFPATATPSGPNTSTISYCGFFRNAGPGVPAVMPESQVTIENCIFSVNFGVGGPGSGIVMELRAWNQSRVINCTFINDRIDLRGGGLGQDQRITNCITWGGGVTSGVSCAPTVIAFSNVNKFNSSEIFPGMGNIFADPLFVDPDGADNILGTEDDDLRLLPGSPCIDAGLYFGGMPSTDLDGHARAVDDTATTNTGLGLPPVDMGAYEFGSVLPPSGIPADIDLDGDVDGIDFLTLSNCFNGSMNPPNCP